MLRSLILNDQPLRIDEDQPLLPIMTAAFVEGLRPGNNSRGRSDAVVERPESEARIAKIFRMPLPGDRQGAGKSGNHPQSADVPIPRNLFRLGDKHSETNHLTIRSLISGISHNFNNILMGIWGNATLIHMNLAESDPLCMHVAKMEKLIQSGAFLIHMVLGYLGERRIAARRVRLNQIILEIKEDSQFESAGNEPWNLEERLLWAANIQQPQMIAGSTARVLDVLFQRIKSHHLEIGSVAGKYPGIQEKLDKVDALLARGFDMTMRLQCYAVDLKLHKVRIRLEPMLKRAVRQLQTRCPHLTVSLEVGPNLPLTYADRSRIEWVLQELVGNAIDAQTPSLSITARLQTDELPEDRCSVRTGRDYVVVTIKDQGKGIAADIQKHIFEPFFKQSDLRPRKGLGLAAATGIMKAHGGYIQVQSKKGSGSVFKLYLDITSAVNASRIFHLHTKKMEKTVKLARK